MKSSVDAKPAPTHARGVEHDGARIASASTDGARDSLEACGRACETRDAREVTLSMDGFGDVRLTLKPEWHASSVEYLRALASESETSCEETCEVYRVEPGFLVQGTLRSRSIEANAETKPGPKLMERGDVGWAGEGPGPDFFVYLGENPARHFGRAHTVFAVVADEASMAVLERVVAAPSSTPGGPGTMRFIDRRPRVRVSAS